MIKVAFDIDDTIYKISTDSHGKFIQVPDYSLINVLLWFYENGDDVIVWSAGGTDYAAMIVDKLGLTGKVRIAQKGKVDVDIAFDDMSGTKLAKADVKVKRPKREEI